MLFHATLTLSFPTNLAYGQTGGSSQKSMVDKPNNLKKSVEANLHFYEENSFQSFEKNIRGSFFVPFIEVFFIPACVADQMRERLMEFEGQFLSKYFLHKCSTLEF